MVKRTIDPKTLEEVKLLLPLDLGADQAKETVRKMRMKVDSVFGSDFTDDFCEALATLVGVDIITSPDNPLNIACKDQAQIISEQEKVIALQQEELIQLRSRCNVLQDALCSVRKIVKCPEVGELEQEAHRLKGIEKPNLQQRIILTCQEKFRDILIRTKGC